MMSSKTILVTIGVLVLAAFVLAGCGDDTGSTSSPSGIYEGTDTTGGAGTGGTETTGTGSARVVPVVERGFAFEPASVTVKVGDVVTWTNEDAAAHDVEIDGTQLGAHQQGQSVTWTAESPGTYPYLCTIHPEMKGEVIVE